MSKSENEVPGLIKMSQLQQVYKNLWEEDDSGAPVRLKMQATTEFKEAFNKFVYMALLDCVDYARSQGRKMLTAEDVPSQLIDDEPDEEDSE